MKACRRARCPNSPLLYLGGTYSREAFPVIMLVAHFICFLFLFYGTVLYLFFFARLYRTARYCTAPFFMLVLVGHSPHHNQSSRVGEWHSVA